MSTHYKPVRVTSFLWGGGVENNFRNKRHIYQKDERTLRFTNLFQTRDRRGFAMYTRLFHVRNEEKGEK